MRAHDEVEVRRKQARACAAGGDVEGEVEAWSALVLLDPLDVEARACLARLARRRGFTAEALIHAQVLTQVTPEDSHGWRRLVRVVSELGDRDGEAVVLTRMLRAGFGEIGSGNRLIRLLTDLGRHADAAAQLRALAESEPGSAAGWDRLIGHCRRAGDVDGEIAASLDRLSRVGPDSATRARLVRLLSERGRLLEAAAQLRVMVEADPANPGGWRALVRLHRKSGDAEGEIAALEAQLRLAGPDEAAIARLAKLLADDRRREAWRASRHAPADADPTPQEEEGRITRARQQAGDVEGEIEALQRLVDLGAGERKQCGRLVGLLLQSGRQAEAAVQLRRIVKADPGDVDGWLGLVRIAGELGDAAGEIHALERLVQIGWPDSGARARLVRLLAEAGRAADAAVHQRKLAEATPASREAWHRLAELCREAGDAEGEIAALQDSLAPAGLDEASIARLGALLVEVGRTDEAVALLRAEAEAAPDRPDGWTRLTQLSRQVGDLEGEVAGLDGRLKAAGPDTATRARLVKLLAENGRAGEAATHARALAEADPADPEGWSMFARMCRLIGDVDGEIDASLRRLELGAGDAAMRTRMLALLGQSGRGPETVPHYRALAHASPRLAKAWRQYRAAATTYDDRDAEIEALKGLVGVEPQNLSAHERLAALQLANGRRAEALEHLRIDPDGRQAALWRALGDAYASAGRRAAAVAARARADAFAQGGPTRSASGATDGTRVAAIGLQAYGLERLVGLEGGRDVAAVEAEAARIGDLLQAAADLDEISAGGPCPLARVVFDLVLERMGRLAETATTREPMGLRGRWDALARLCADPRFEALAAREMGGLSSFVKGRPRGRADQSSLMDPAWAAAARLTADRTPPPRSTQTRRRLAGAVAQGQELLSAPAFAEPVLICGFHHSGTRLLAQALEAAGVFQRVNTGTFEWTYVQHLNTVLLPGWMDVEAIEAFVPERAVDVISQAAIARRLTLAGYGGGTAWGCKDPRSGPTAEAWLRVFPGARIVHLMRDPMDTLGALPPHYAHFAPGHVRPQHAAGFWTELWRASYRRSLAAMARAGRACEVRFEDLCADPLGVTRQVCRSLGLDACFDADRLEALAVDFGSDRRPPAPDRAWPAPAQAGGDHSSPGRRGRLRPRLTARPRKCA